MGQCALDTIYKLVLYCYFKSKESELFKVWSAACDEWKPISMTICFLGFFKKKKKKETHWRKAINCRFSKSITIQKWYNIELPGRICCWHCCTFDRCTIYQQSHSIAHTQWCTNVYTALLNTIDDSNFHSHQQYWSRSLLFISVDLL